METSVSTATQPEQPQPEVTQSTAPQIDSHKRKRGSNNHRYGNGPSLQEQRDFLNGINREYYTRKYIHSV